MPLDLGIHGSLHQVGDVDLELHQLEAAILLGKALRIYLALVVFDPQHGPHLLDQLQHLDGLTIRFGGLEMPLILAAVVLLHVLDLGLHVDNALLDLGIGHHQGDGAIGIEDPVLQQQHYVLGEGHQVDVEQHLFGFIHHRLVAGDGVTLVGLSLLLILLHHVIGDDQKQECANRQQYQG